MTQKSEQLSDALHAYLVGQSMPLDQVQLDLIAETQAALPDQAGMQIAPEQGSFMTILTRLIGARNAVEIGTFTGYSALAVARGLADGGRLLCCDISEEFTGIARKYWERAGVADRIDLVIAPALETLRALPVDTVFDLAFIDAEKEGYVDYWEEVVPRMRTNGIILVDNTLSHGRVVDESTHGSTSVQGILRFNEHALADERVELVLLPIGDGLTFARKR